MDYKCLLCDDLWPFLETASWTWQDIVQRGGYTDWRINGEAWREGDQAEGGGVSHWYCTLAEVYWQYGPDQY